KPHPPQKKIHLKRGGYQGKKKADPRKKVINMGCWGGVVTQAYGQPDTPVLLWGLHEPPPYLPPRHFADCHNRKRTVEEI
ncbi:hypothetical protein, partial [Escherichia coli]|uniref:hypothetical protein n=1 Tax=Escherichia coli TaxID=562 RepID=UPI000AF1CD0C